MNFWTSLNFFFLELNKTPHLTFSLVSAFTVCGETMDSAGAKIVVSSFFSSVITTTLSLVSVVIQKILKKKNTGVSLRSAVY
jgi:hypothetical protein